MAMRTFVFAFLLVLFLVFGIIGLSCLKFSNEKLEVNIPGNKPMFLVGLKNISERFKIKILKLVEFEDLNNNSMYDNHDKKVFFANLLSLRWSLNYTSNKSSVVTYFYLKVIL